LNLTGIKAQLNGQAIPDWRSDASARSAHKGVAHSVGAGSLGADQGRHRLRFCIELVETACRKTRYCK